MYKEIMHAINKYLELKTCGAAPNSNYLLSSFASQDTTTCQNNATTHVKSMNSHTVLLRHGNKDTCALFSFLSIPPNLEFYHTIWLVMHVILLSHIVFLHSRHKRNSECSDMHTGTVFNQGRREFIRVQTVLAAGDNSYLYVITAC